MGQLAHGVFAFKSKARILVAVFIFLVIAAALFGVRSYQPSKKANSAPKAQKYDQTAIVAEVRKDSDSDGLKDWEEAIWRTDPQKADSDGDGDSDGEEVIMNRNPLVAGPNDRNAAAANTGEADKPEPTNLTAQISARISSDVLGGAIGSGNESELKAFANAYADDLSSLSVLDRAPAFSASDLAASKTNDLAAVVQFFAAIETVWQKHFRKDQPTDLEIFFRAFEENNGDSAPSMLEPYIQGYSDAIAVIRKTPVPSDLEKTAVDLLNYLSRIRQSAELMRGFGSDPLAAMLAVRERLRLNEEFQIFINNALANAERIIKMKVAELSAGKK